MPDRIELHRLESHPLAQRFYDLSFELENLPADVRQSDIARKLGDLKRETQALLDDATYRAKLA
jgi:hypothetical protein